MFTAVEAMASSA